LDEIITNLFLFFGNWSPSLSLSKNQDSVPDISVDKSEVVYAVPHSYILGQYIELPYMKALHHIQDIESTPDLVEITESELKLIALN